MTRARSSHALRIERAPLAGPVGAAELDDGRVIGGLSYGRTQADHGAAGTSEGGPRLASVPAPVLAGAVTHDVFLGGNVEAEGQCGQVHWCHDGHWLFGQLELDESNATTARLPQSGQPSVLEKLAQQAYRDIFATLVATGFKHLQRLWNYVPRINEDGGGLERYRQFNIGRQRAFLEAGRAAFDGAPAACALGTRDAPLCVRFLAGDSPPLPIENPRQVSAYRYPGEFGPRSPSFSRAALTDVGSGRVALLISGTASIVGHQSLHPCDVAAQTREALNNLHAVIAAARAQCDAPFSLHALQCVIYVREPADQAAVRRVLDAELGSTAPAVRDAVWLRADICRRELLVEIEGHQILPGRLLDVPSGAD